MDPFNYETLFATPSYSLWPGPEVPGVRALVYEGEQYRGNPTRIFAWYGAATSFDRHQKSPGIVLVHGGLATASASWVRLWNARGYNAIAMDLDGCLPEVEGDNYRRLPGGGPQGILAKVPTPFEQINEPITDQWCYHAVTAVVRGHSLLRSFEGVDSERIGITGISWGGFLTAVVSGLDQRLKFAVPVYGCGYIDEGEAWRPDFDALGPEASARWMQLWDPSNYLPEARLPMLWINGTNDFAFQLPIHQKSYRLPTGAQHLAIRVRMDHGGEAGENAPEIPVFADSILNDGTPLVSITGQGQSGPKAWASFHAPGSTLLSAELTYTTDRQERWTEREWCTLPADIHTDEPIITADLPPGVSGYYFNLFDHRGCCTSSELYIVTL